MINQATRIWLLMVISVLLYSPSKGMTDSSLFKVKNRGELIIGVSAIYPPFVAKDPKTGSITGFDIELSRALAKEMGLGVRFVECSWQNLFGKLNSNQADILISAMSKAETRGENVIFSDTYKVSSNALVVNAKNNTIQGMNDLSGKTVAVMTGTGGEMIADSAKSSLGRIMRFETHDHAMDALKNRQVDAVITDYAYTLNKMKQEKAFKVVGKPLSVNELVMVAPKGAETLMNGINRALSRIRQNGEFDRIYDQWLRVE